MATKRKGSKALSWIIKEAKHLRRKDHNRKAWKDYIKQASAIYASKHGGKSPVGKKRNVASVKYIEKGQPKNTRPDKIYETHRNKKGQFKNYRRLSSVTTKSKTHTDKNKITANIQVGATSYHNYVMLEHLKRENSQLSDAEKKLHQLKQYAKGMKRGVQKTLANRAVKQQQKYISTIKSNIRSLKTLIR
jgi:hypothetical protein